MLHSKLIFVILMSWTLGKSDALLSSLLAPLTKLIAPVTKVIAGSENAKLCSLDTAGIIRYYGYKNETRKVTTEDGYVITVHCLSNSTALNSTLDPVIAWHGMGDASHTFCLNSKNQSLAFLLADKGYYVCLPNARGNTYSREYTNSSRKADLMYGSFWKFSWDEIAQFDVSAVIDAVLSWTRKSKVIYIGHSQGATTLFALLSSKPNYNDKVAIFAALAPVVFFTHTTSPPYVGAKRFQAFFEAFYGGEFSRHTDIQTLISLIGCTLPTRELCKNLLFFLFGYSNHTNESKLPVYMCKSPSDLAWGQFVQYVQHVRVDKFQKYDFKSQNKKKYGQSSPPQYDLTKVTAPLALFHSDGDLTTADIDVQSLKSILDNNNNLVFEQHLPASLKFNHLDYVWAKDVREIVYNDLINVISNY